MSVMFSIAGCGNDKKENTPSSQGSTVSDARPSQSANSNNSSSTTSSGKTFNLMDYVTVTVTGDSGSGKAAYTFDYGAFEDALAKVLNLKKDSAQFFSDATIIEEAISFSFDKLSGLSNGDSVLLTVSVNDTNIKKYDITLKGGTSTYSVNDLTEIAEFNIAEHDVVALLSNTEIIHHMQTIVVLPENVIDMTIVDSQVISSNKAKLDYTYDLDCTIAILSVKGSVEYTFENGEWQSFKVTHLTELEAYTLSGTYTGTEWDIAGAGVSCNARYEISELSEGVYEAKVTWNAGSETPGMTEISATILLSIDFMTARFIILGNDAALIAAVGRSPYLARALKFDFVSGGFTADGEVVLQKTSD